MKTYCFWECVVSGTPFIVDTAKVVDLCPFHFDLEIEIDADTGKAYENHFESGHVKRIFSESLLKRL